MTPFNYSPIQLAWLAALKSGEYAQTQKFLCAQKDGKRSYCCLGLGCEIVNKLMPSELPELTNQCVEFDSQSTQLSSRAMNALGVRDSMGRSHSGARSLVTLNDGEGFTFPQIAAAIEANPEDYLYSA